MRAFLSLWSSVFVIGLSLTGCASSGESPATNVVTNSTNGNSVTGTTGSGTSGTSGGSSGSSGTGGTSGDTSGGSSGSSGTGGTSGGTSGGSSGSSGTGGTSGGTSGGSSGSGGTGGGTDPATTPTNTAIIYAVGNRPTVGGNPTVSPVAVSGGPDFSVGPAASVGTSFPLTQDAFVVDLSSRVIGQHDTVVDRGATLTPRANGIELAIAQLGIDVVIGQTGTVDVSLGRLSLGLLPYTYVLGGFWTLEYANPQFDPNFIYSMFTTGYRTALNKVPFIGTANYERNGFAFGAVAIRTGPLGNDAATAEVSGDFQLTVDFSNNIITGALTNMVAVDINGTQTAWNNIAIDGSIPFSSGVGNEIRGYTSVTSTPNTMFALNGTATGFFEGFLYGPFVDEAGIVWNISNRDEPTGSAVGFAIAERAGGTIPSSNRPAYFFGSIPETAWTTSSPPVIAKPVSANIDKASNAPIFATAGGPTFSGSGQFTQFQNFFPIRLTAMQYTPAGMSASADATGARIILDAQNTPPGSPYVSSYAVTIPSSGVDSIQGLGGFVEATHLISTPLGWHGGGSGRINTFGLDYTAFGAWLQSNSTGWVNMGYFNFGFETSVASVPLSGTATYSEPGGVVGKAMIRSGNTVSEAVLGGDAQFTANFATGTITGSFTNMNAYTPTTSSPWNNVSVNAAIISGTNSFSGSTDAASSTGEFALHDSATGHINGGFYGPNANEIGAVWSLGNGDGSGSAMGVAGARR